MPSISLRFSPASAIASAAALLMRSSEEEPSCLPNAVSPTPVMKLMTRESLRLRHSGARAKRASPESITMIGSMDSGSAPSGASRNDELEFLDFISRNTSIRLRQAQHLLGDKTENELRADRGDARDQGFAQIALDMKLPRVAEAAVGHHGLLASLEAGFGGEIFRGIGRGAAWHALIVLPTRRQRHQPRRLELDPVLRERMLDRLVLADRTIEHDAAFRIGRGTRKRELAETDGFRCNQNAFRIHAVQDVFEAAAFLAKAILKRNLKILDEQFVGVDGLAAHLLDFMNRNAATIEIGIEQAETVSRILHFFQRRSACQQQNLFGDLGSGDPDLLAADDVFVAGSYRAGFQLRGVEAGIGFGDGEAGLLCPFDDRRQHPLALLVIAEHHNGTEAEHIHMHRGGAGHAGAGFRNRPHHDRGIHDPQTGAAIGLGNADAEPAGIRQGLVEVGRETALLVLLQPIGIVETRADLCHGVADRFLIGCESEIHGSQSLGVSGADLVTPSRTNAAISSAEKPASCKISAPCSLSRGASRVGSTELSDQVADTFMLRIGPSVGWLTTGKKSVATRCGSCKMLSRSCIGMTGTSALSSSSVHSAVVRISKMRASSA